MKNIYIYISYTNLKYSHPLIQPIYNSPLKEKSDIYKEDHIV